MSMATTKKDTGFRKETLGSTAVRVVQTAAKKVAQDLFGILALFAVLTTGIGQFFAQVSLYWYLTTLLLLGLAFYRDSKQK